MCVCVCVCACVCVRVYVCVRVGRDQLLPRLIFSIYISACNKRNLMFPLVVHS